MNTQLSRSGLSQTIITLLLGAAFLLTAISLFQTLLPIKAGLENFSATWVGLLGTAYFAGFILGCIYGPQLVHSVGHIRAFAGIVAFAAALTLIFPYGTHIILWLSLRLLTGFTSAIAFMVLESWLNHQAENTIRGRILSIYIIVANLATMAGQMLLNVSTTADASLFLLVTFFYCLAVITLALIPTTEPSPIPTAKLKLKELLNISPTGTIGCFMIGMVEGAFWTLGPVFGQQTGMTVFEVTLLMTAFVLGGTLSQWPLGRLSDQRDRRLVILPVSTAAIFTGILIAFWTSSNLMTILTLATLHGALMIPLYALFMAHTNDGVEPDNMVQMSSGLLLVYSLGAVIGPAAASQIMENSSPGGLFIFISGTLGAMVLFILYRFRFGSPHERLGDSGFTPLPKTSQSLFELEVDDKD